MSEYLHKIESRNRENGYRGPLGRLRRWRDLLREDIETVYRKDPAARSAWEVLTCYPGLHAVWLHRPAHALWQHGHPFLARVLSHMARFLTGIEIHPGARIGRRFFIDHGSGVVIGETAQVGDDVLMYQGAVLGGTSAERTKRHPSVDDGVVVGANAVLLGNITIGARSKVGSGSVVVESVPVGATVVGIPGRVVRVNGRRPRPRAQDVLDHGYLPDPVVETLRCLVDRVELLEAEVRHLSRTSPVDLEEPVPMGCSWLAASAEEGKSDGSRKSG
jgi:serine O-acetyltransferase